MTSVTTAMSAGRIRFRKAINWLGNRRTQEALAGYLLISPAFTLFLVYYGYAIVRALWMSFTNYRFLAPELTEFVGLNNYVKALQDRWVIAGFQKAGYFTLLYYPGIIIFPLIVALVLDRVRHTGLASLYRVLIYIPAAVPAALTYRLWAYIYRPSYGLLNTLLVDVFRILQDKPQWLVSSNLIFPPIAVMHWWGAIGSQTLFYLVGLSSINSELYEAARLDGASEFQLIHRITLPLLRRTILVWTVLNIGAFAIAAEMLAMWGGQAGGTPRAAWTWAFYALETGLTQGNMPLGYATAIGWLGAIAMVLVAAVVYFLLGRDLDY